MQYLSKTGAGAWKHRPLALGFMLLLALPLASCDHPNLFSSDNSSSLWQSENAGPALVRVEITGGFAGVNQLLVVQSDGAVLYYDRYPDGGYVTIALSGQEVAELRSVFINNNFLGLNRRYVGAGADYFYYDITYTQNDVSNSVLTDYEHAPQQLRNVIDRLRGLIERLRARVLEIRLEVSADTLRSGESLTLKLIATNTTAQTQRLHFASGQEYNFFAVAAQQISHTTYRSEQERLWSWDNGMAFIQVISNVDLPAGERLEYTTTWDGRGNDGTRVSGNILLGAELVSNPGGASELQSIYVQR